MLYYISIYKCLLEVDCRPTEELKEPVILFLLVFLACGFFFWFFATRVLRCIARSHRIHQISCACGCIATIQECSRAAVSVFVVVFDARRWSDKDCEIKRGMDIKSKRDEI